MVYEGEDCCGFFYVDKLGDDTYEAASSGVLSEYMGIRQKHRFLQEI